MSKQIIGEDGVPLLAGHYLRHLHDTAENDHRRDWAHAATEWIVDHNMLYEPLTWDLVVRIHAAVDGVTPNELMLLIEPAGRA